MLWTTSAITALAIASGWFFLSPNLMECCCYRLQLLMPSVSKVFAGCVAAIPPIMASHSIQQVYEYVLYTHCDG